MSVQDVALLLLWVCWDGVGVNRRVDICIVIVLKDLNEWNMVPPHSNESVSHRRLLRRQSRACMETAVVAVAGLSGILP